MRSKELNEWILSGEYDELHSGKLTKKGTQSSRLHHLGHSRTTKDEIDRTHKKFAKHIKGLDEIVASEKRMYISKNIPHKKLTTAITAFGQGIKASEVLLLYDSSTFGGAKSGLILTSKKALWKNFSDDTYNSRNLEKISKLTVRKSSKITELDKLSIDSDLLDSSECDPEVLKKAISFIRHVRRQELKGSNG